MFCGAGGTGGAWEGREGEGEENEALRTPIYGRRWQGAYPGAWPALARSASSLTTSLWHWREGRKAHKHITV